MKNRYFSSRTLPQPPATFPELSGTATEFPGAAQKRSGGPSSAPAPARAESGRPQNWSPAISGGPKPLKINEKSYFSPRTLPQPPATFPELSGTATELPGAAQKLSGGGPAPARAESDWPRFRIILEYQPF